MSASSWCSVVIVFLLAGACDGTTPDAPVTHGTYVKASNTDAEDQFGSALALSADGSTLAVAAYGEDSGATGIDGDQGDNGTPLAGAVYVFAREGATWSQQAYLKASNTYELDHFGYALALSGDGSTLAVGAFGEDSSATGVNGDQTNDTAISAGAVYVFGRAGGTWSQQAYVKATNTGADDEFGSAVALSADGSTLAIGAWSEDSSTAGIDGDQADNTATNAGAVYVLTRVGATWSHQAYVKASNTDAGDQFGIALALSANGSTLAVGAHGESSRATGIGGDQSDDSAESAGAVYVFARAGGTWSQQAYVKASNAGMSDRFGYAVALADDGSTLAVGAWREASRATGIDGDEANDSADDAGAAYVFTRAGTAWSQRAYVKASNTDAGDRFGHALALSSDASTLVIGAHRESSGATRTGGDESSNSAPSAGAVYVFTQASDRWSQQAYVKASNTDAGDYFGFALALTGDGTTLGVGAYNEASAATGIDGDQADDSAPTAGAVYVH